MMHEIDSENQFKELILDSGEKKHHKKFAVVDFYADWCQPCKKFSPTYEKFAETYGEHILFLKVNIDDNSELALTYNIRKLPSFMFFNIGDLASKYDVLIGTDETKMENRLKYFHGTVTGTDEDF